MEEDFFSDSLPYLRELENKIGRKTPQSLLIWMRDAAECEDAAWSADAEGECGSAFNPVLSDKIRMLKQEMVKFATVILPSHLSPTEKKVNTFCGIFFSW